LNKKAESKLYHRRIRD